MPKNIFDFYFRPNSFERHGTIYRVLGVSILQKIVLATAGKFVTALRNKKDLPGYFVTKFGSIEAIEKTERWSRFNEIVHSWFVFFCLALVIFYSHRKLPSGEALLALAALLNFYLALLQRYNRVRLYRTIELIRRRHHKH
jgi:hypothetical protein